MSRKSKTEIAAQRKAKRLAAKLLAETQIVETTPVVVETPQEHVASFKRYHLTNGYAGYHHPKDSEATRVTEKRESIIDAVRAGGESLGSIKRFPQALRNVARRARGGVFAVAGWTPTNGKMAGSAGAKIDIEQAAELVIMPLDTAISFVREPARRTESR